MKNHLKKLISLLLVAMMIMAMGSVAFAGDTNDPDPATSDPSSSSPNTASITITHDATYEDYVDPDESIARVYLAYKIFDASYESLSGANTQDDKDDFEYTPDDAPVAYSIKSNSPWLSVMQSDDQIWFDVKEDANGNFIVTPIDGEYEDTDDAIAFAEYLADNIPDDATGTEVTVDGDAVDVEPGYYLIIAKDDKDSVTRLALVTTDVTLVEKNTYIDTEKDTEQTSYTIGQIIPYTASVSIPSDTALTQKVDNEYKAGHGPIILHDIMDSVLKFDPTSVVATIDGDEFTEFELVEDPDDECTFEIIIDVTEDLLGATIDFEYSAELTSAAVNPDTGFINKFFGEINGYKTVPDEPIVYTFDFNFSKTFVGSEDTELVATFELRTDADDGSTAIAFIAGENAGEYIVADIDHEEEGDTVITSANNALINVQGLQAGTYYLVELSTSTGYNLLDGPAEVVITDTTEFDQDGKPVAISHEVTIDGSSSTADDPTLIQNKSGNVLPSTGGVGTTIFYIIGTVLVLGAAVLLVSKKRMGAHR